MHSDQPQTIVKKQSKAPAVERLFLERFNAQYAKQYRLVLCSQDFSTFDYWMFDVRKPKAMPYLVELKHHKSRDISKTNLIGCDLIKIQKLKAYSQDTRAFVFHLLNDGLLIQDVTTPLDDIRDIIYQGRSVVLGLIKLSNCVKQLSLGYQDLILLRDSLPSEAFAEKSPGATAQGFEAHADLDDSF